MCCAGAVLCGVVWCRRYKALGQLSTFDARTSRGFLAEQRKCDRDDAVGLEASMP